MFPSSAGRFDCLGGRGQSAACNTRFNRLATTFAPPSANMRVVSEPDAPQDYFEELVGAALAQVPEPFASRLGTVAIVIDDVATPAQLAATGAPGLFGIYEGVPRTMLAADMAPVASKITIFRLPLEAYHRDRESLARAVRETVFHEIAHHFGISDARLAELSRKAGGRPADRATDVR
jgi:predicted Zn-dependent protease with MMP-like domain